MSRFGCKPVTSAMRHKIDSRAKMGINCMLVLACIDLEPARSSQLGLVCWGQ